MRALPVFLLLAASASAEEFQLEKRDDRVIIRDGAAEVGEFVHHDEKILRPYFANLRAPGGQRVTRAFPPQPDKDATDHADMHPGVWLGFGDVSGHDFWRNQGRIVHERFLIEPVAQGGRVSFVSVSRMEAAGGEVIAKALNAFILSRVVGGYRLEWTAKISPKTADFAFGDQEEMGFGVRVATELTEKNGGLITNSARFTKAADVWGQPADWCDCSRVIDGTRVGLLLVPSGANPQPAWWHVRDYGLMVANAFGRKAMKQGEASRIAVPKGTSYTLGHILYLYAVPAEAKPAWERYPVERH